MTKFELQKARRSYGVFSKYQSFPSDKDEQIKLLGEYGYDNAKIGKGISLKNANPKQVFAFSRRVFNESHNYWLDLSSEQKKQVPEFCFDQYLKLQYQLKTVDKRLKSPENLPLVFRLHSEYLDQPVRFEEQRQLVEQYGQRLGALNASNLDSKEVTLFSKKIYSTINDVINSLDLETKKTIYLSDQVSRELKDISKIPNKERRAAKIRDLESRLNLIEIEERLSIQYEGHEVYNLPPAIRALHSTLNLRHQIEQGYISNPEVAGNVEHKREEQRQSIVDKLFKKQPIVKSKLVIIPPTNNQSIQEDLFQEKVQEIPF